MRSFTRSLRALPRAFPVVNSPRSLHITARRLEATSKPSSADDPYPLPLSPDHVTPESNKPGTSPRDVEVDLSDPGLPFPEPLSREGESVDQKRARLVYQTRKRGTLESDLLMSTFAKEHMDSMNEEELREFDRVSKHVLAWNALLRHICHLRTILTSRLWSSPCLITVPHMSGFVWPSHFSPASFAATSIKSA
jgi:hypothetical protein